MTFVFRKDFAIEVEYCTCGAFSICILAAREQTFTEYGYEQVGACTYELMSTEEDDCQEEMERRVVMPTASSEIFDDITKILRGMNRVLPEENHGDVKRIIEETIEGFELVDLASAGHRN